MPSLLLSTRDRYPRVGPIHKSYPTNSIPLPTKITNRSSLRDLQELLTVLRSGIIRVPSTMKPDFYFSRSNLARHPILEKTIPPTTFSNVDPC